MSRLPWSLPLTGRFVKNLFDDLTNEGTSAVVLFPRDLPAGFLDVLREQLNHIYALSCEYEPSSAPAKPGEILPWEQGGPSDPVALARTHKLAAGVNLVYGLEHKDWPYWEPFLRAFCQNVRNSGLELWKRPRLCCLFTHWSGRLAPTPDAGLTVHDGSGHPCRLDMRYLAWELDTNTDDFGQTMRALRQELLVELAGNDMALLRHIIHWPTSKLMDPATSLVDHARSLGVDRQAVHWQEQVDGRNRPHVLAQALKKPDALAERVWQAQMTILFPWLERIRLHVIDQWRPRLNLPWSHVNQVITDPRDLEFVHLQSQMRYMKALQDERLLEHFRSIRNGLAHHEPVPFDLLRRVPREWWSDF